MALLDRPLCWQPLQSSLLYCAVCGASFGSLAEQLAELSGMTRVKLPTFPDLHLPAKRETTGIVGEQRLCEDCHTLYSPRADGVTKTLVAQQEEQDELTASWSANQFILLGAQAVSLMISRYYHDPMLVFDALASPPWWQVCPQDPNISDKAQHAKMRDELTSALATLHETYSELSEFGLESWARVVGAMARNAITVQIPSPVVGYLVRLEEAPTSAKKRKLMSSIAKVVEKLKEQAEEDGREEEEEEEKEDGEEEEEKEDGEEDDEETEDGEEEESSEDEDGFFEEDIEFVWEIDGSDTKAGGRENAGRSRGEKVGGSQGGGSKTPATYRLEFSSRLFPSAKGWAVYPLLSLANHSCDPNCKVTFSDSNMVSLITLREIASGEELTLSYVDVHANLEKRRGKLQARYGFHCVCSKCVVEEKQMSSAPIAKRQRVSQ